LLARENARVSRSSTLERDDRPGRRVRQSIPSPEASAFALSPDGQAPSRPLRETRLARSAYLTHAARRLPVAVLQRSKGVGVDPVEGLEGHCACGGGCAECAAAAAGGLAIGPPDDVFEREADLVAERVLMGVKPGWVPTAAPSRLQRACSCRGPLGAGVEECESCSSGSRLQREVAERGPVRAPPAVQSVLASSGRPLDAPIRALMERGFGRDFGDVRVHLDARAAESARAVRALAYTVGRDVVFGSRQFAPGTAAGDRLLAHELTHVIQQSDHRAERLQRQVSPASSHLQSPRFSPSAKLERCFEDTDRLGQGDPDTDAVKRIQQALIDVQQITGNTYDLGSTGPNNDGVDGDYGPKTAAAVKKFKADENLGFTEFGDVGPGTMHRLDELFSTGEISPAPTPTAPTPTPVLIPPSPAPPTPAPAPIPPTPPTPTSPAGKRCPTPGTSGVTGIPKAQQDFSGRSTTRFGVGEAVNLFFDSFLSRHADPAHKAVPHAGLKWVQTAGPGSLSKINERAGTATFTADRNAGTVKLELRVFVGPCAGSMVANVSFEIIKPTGGIMERVLRTKLFHSKGTWSVGFLGTPFLRPTDVSFIAVAFKEGSARARATGWLSDRNGELHPEKPTGLPVGPGDITKGCEVKATGDEVLSGRKPPPFAEHKEGNEFLWEIPWKFSLGGGPFEQFTFANQKATADDKGKATIEKKGAGPFSAEANDDNSDFF
jgi:peptidoglycan hydrolase-like protein with peptidoglycan-binding domain